MRNNTITPKENDDFEIFVLTSNDNIRNLIDKVNFNIGEKVINRFKSLVKDLLKSSNLDFEKIMSEINNKLKKIEDFQSIKSELENFKLENSQKLKVSESFRLTIDEIINQSRPDFEFIELIPFSGVSPINNTNIEGGLIDIFPDSISGTTPSQNGIYNYNIYLSIVSAKDGSNMSIHTVLTLTVGDQSVKKEDLIEKPNKIEVEDYKEESKSKDYFISFVLVASVITLILLFTIFIICIMKRCRKLKILYVPYEENKEATPKIESEISDDKDLNLSI